jgi:hypothetical protein
LLERLYYLSSRTGGGLHGKELEAGPPFAGAHRRGSGHGGGVVRVKLWIEYIFLLIGVVEEDDDAGDGCGRE